jgi:glyoxylase-like metal-dependent hydrolase (beta-lactamase superfamily II)
MVELEWPDALELGPVTVLTGTDRGKYPHGNSLLVAGTRDTVLIDPSLTVYERGVPAEVHHVVLSHVHEDHVPGLSLLPDTPVHCHEADAVGLRSLDGLMEMYGMPPEIEAQFRGEVVEDFAYAPRAEVHTFEDGASFDLGGVTIDVVHTPGHTRGHCVLMVPQARTAYLGDIELTGFGPYYGDAWSSLEDFEKSIARCRTLDADHFVTFHHKWVIDGRDQLLPMLDAFQGVIDDRERRMLEFLAEPRTIEDCADHRFVYRPGVEVLFVDYVERRCATAHIERMQRDGRVIEVEPQRYRAA